MIAKLSIQRAGVHMVHQEQITGLVIRYVCCVPDICSAWQGSVTNAPRDYEHLCGDVFCWRKVISRLHIHPVGGLTYSECEADASIDSKSARIGMYFCQVANHES